MSPIVKACGLCGGPRGRCGCSLRIADAKRSDSRRRNAKTRAHGVKRAHFQRLRSARLAYAGGLCELVVGRGCTRVATTVHLDPALEGAHDRATLDDVRAACRHCHGVVDGRRSAG